MLLRAAGRVQQHRLPPERHQPQHAVGLEEVVGERGCDADAVLFRALVAVACLDAGVQVEKEGDVARRVHLERLHHQPVEARGGAPVDAVVAVAGLIVTDGGGVRGDVVRAAANGALARELSGRHPEVGELLRQREDDERMADAVAAAEVEQAERVAGADRDRSHGEHAAAAAGQAQLPVTLAVGGQGDDGARRRAGHIRGILQLQPQLRVEGAAAQPHSRLCALAHLETVGGALHGHRQAAQVGACPDEADRHQPADHVGGTVEQRVAADDRQAQHRAESADDEEQVLIAAEEPEQADDCASQGRLLRARAPVRRARAAAPGTRRRPVQPSTPSPAPAR